MAFSAALIEVPASGEVTASSTDRRQCTCGLGVVALVLALLLGGIVVGITAAARVDELVAESLRAVVEPAGHVVVAVTRFEGQEALGRVVLHGIGTNADVYVDRAASRALLLGGKAVIIAATAAVVERLTATLGLVVVPVERPFVALSWISRLTALSDSRSRIWLPGWSRCSWRSRGRRLLAKTTLLTIVLCLEAIAIAATVAIVELTASPNLPIEVPLEDPGTTFSWSGFLVTDVLPTGLWPGGGGGGCGFGLAVATRQTGLLGGEAVLIAPTAAVVELATGLILSVVVPAGNVVGTLAHLGRNLTDVLS